LHVPPKAASPPTARGGDIKIQNSAACRLIKKCPKSIYPNQRICLKGQKTNATIDAVSKGMCAF